MSRLDRFVVAFAVIGLAFFAVVIGTSLADAFPGWRS